MGEAIAISYIHRQVPYPSCFGDTNDLVDELQPLTHRRLTPIPKPRMGGVSA
jgi:hypothetical protein